MTFALIKQFNSKHAHINFEGKFQGKNVIWDTHFFTTDEYYSVEMCDDTKMKQFINIEPQKNNTMKLTVALKLAEITEPNILKMMIMIKQYKNLSFGLHEYG